MNPLKRSVFLLASLATLAAAARADFTVTGTFQYVDRAFTFNGFSGVEPNLPIRLATVQVINNTTNQVLATGFTSETGAISIPVVASGTADIVVRCFSRSNQFGGQALRVTNTSNVEYSVSSAVFTGWNLGTNLAAGTITAQKVLSGTNQGGPFNLLDMLVRAEQYVKSLGSANPTSSLKVMWPGGSGSFTSGSSVTMADDDGFDDTVALHEIGHMMHNVYSSSDNPGGSHTFGDSDQDPRLSFGEGFATYFAGAVRQFTGVTDPGFYLDCAANGSTGGASIQLRMRHENGSPYAAQTGGEADEGAVFCSLWDVIDTTATNDGDGIDDDGLNGSVPFAGGITGDKMIWNVMTGPLKTAANSTLRTLWNGQFAPIDYSNGQGAALGTSYSTWKQRFTNDSAEPNNTLATATPITLSGAFSATRTLYSATGLLAGPGDGDQDFYSFVLTSGSTFEVETRYPNAAADAETYVDPYLTVFRPNGTILAQSDTSGVGRNAKLTNLVADSSGTFAVRVHTIHSYRLTGSYQLRATLISGPPGGCTNLAATTQFGVGKAGAAGVPTLSSTLPSIPNGAFTMTATPTLPSVPAILFLGLTAIDQPFDGGHLYVSPLASISLMTAPTGSLVLAVPLSDTSLCGLTLHLQAIFPNDPGASGGYHTSQTNRVTVTFGG